jgi:hypothetical protein
MLFRFLTLALSAVALSGCAEIFLENEIEGVEERYGSLSSPYDMRGNGPTPGVGTEMRPTVHFAMEMADAYAKAARHTLISQDLASAVVLASSASAGAAVLDELGDRVVAERVLPGVASLTLARRGVNQSAIQALYRGAMQHNCVAMVGSLYTPEAPNSGINTTPIHPQFAAFVMVLVMREIEYRTFQGRARDVADFSTLTAAFNSALQATTTIGQIEPGPGNGAQTTSRGMEVFRAQESGGGDLVRIQQNPALERFFLALTGCLATAANAQPAPNLSATEPGGNG